MWMSCAQWSTTFYNGARSTGHRLCQHINHVIGPSIMGRVSLRSQLLRGCLPVVETAEMVNDVVIQKKARVDKSLLQARMTLDHVSRALMVHMFYYRRMHVARAHTYKYFFCWWNMYRIRPSNEKTRQGHANSALSYPRILLCHHHDLVSQRRRGVDSQQLTSFNPRVPATDFPTPESMSVEYSQGTAPSIITTLMHHRSARLSTRSLSYR